MSATSPSAARAATPAGPAPPMPRAPLVTDRGTSYRERVFADRWVASGTLKVAHDVEVRTADLRGTTTIGGRVIAESLQARGLLEVDGALDVAGTLTLRGTVHLGGSGHAGDLEGDGGLRVTGDLRVDRTLALRGSLYAPAVAATVVAIDGAAIVPGTVEARKVDATFREATALGVVRAVEVRLRGPRRTLVDKAFFHEPEVHVGRVEGDRVELSEVTVGFVRSPSVVLGPRAHVRELEGTVVRRHPTSSVGPESRSPPPYGLRR